MVGYIYYISNTVNNKLYVGKTLSSLSKRFREHCMDSRKADKKHRPLYRAMRKYGEDKFSIHLLEEVDASQLEKREIYWIQKLDAYKNGYNATHGGEGKILYGEDITVEFINDFNDGMSIHKIAQKHNCSEDIVSQRLLGSGINTQQNRVYNRMTVNQYDTNGDFIQSFPSIRDAARYLTRSTSESIVHSVATNIIRVARGERKTCNGFIWRYAS